MRSFSLVAACALALGVSTVSVTAGTATSGNAATVHKEQAPAPVKPGKKPRDRVFHENGTYSVCLERVDEQCVHMTDPVPVKPAKPHSHNDFGQKPHSHTKPGTKPVSSTYK